MTDRELLEFAAKAAGIEIDWDGGRALVVQMFRGHLKNWVDWDPLTDDGDALRLAVKLRLTIYHDELAVIIKHKRYSWEWMGEMVSEDGGDRNSATRRAIVRAAAEIGKAMP